MRCSRKTYTILTLWSQLQNALSIRSLCSNVYHTDSVESTSKLRMTCTMQSLHYTILTLWSQLQNEQESTPIENTIIPYWLCGVNFKMRHLLAIPPKNLYHTDSVESTSKFKLLRTRRALDIPYWLCGVNFKIRAKFLVEFFSLYHTDSVESTSKCIGRFKLTAICIPYWLCGVNFKIEYPAHLENRTIYHTDSVESTSKCGTLQLLHVSEYTILTL